MFAAVLTTDHYIDFIFQVQKANIASKCTDFLHLFQFLIEFCAFIHVLHHSIHFLLRSFCQSQGWETVGAHMKTGTSFCVERTTAAYCGICEAPLTCPLPSATSSCGILFEDPEAEETPYTA